MEVYKGKILSLVDYLLAKYYNVHLTIRFAGMVKLN